METSRTLLVWLRRDLRLADHTALSAALESAESVHLCFVFDREILDPLLEADATVASPGADRRVDFIWQSVAALASRLQAIGGTLHVRHAYARDAIPALAAELGVDAVYANHDYEPSAIGRDQAVRDALQASGRDLLTFKDQVVFERDEILTGQGTPFSVFTPYRNAWMKRLSEADLAERRVTLDRRLAKASVGEPTAMPSLESMGFRPTNLPELGIEPGEDGARRALDEFAQRIGRYRETRDFPSIRGPSYLSVHMRFGTVSVRAAARMAHQTMRADPGSAEGATTWLNELIWREFYFQILHHHPRVVDQAFKPAFDAIRWADDDALFQAWCAGRTGYPIIDAAIGQILHSGYMHNRLRMIAASFLVKDLGIDWRRGERWFARHLNDFDLAANNGGWQWAASTGCDSQPYFRIFNPVTQSQKFDANGDFIRRYVPALAKMSAKWIHAPWLAPAAELDRAGVRPGVDYPMPVVDHALARQTTLERYAAVRG